MRRRRRGGEMRRMRRRRKRMRRNKGEKLRREWIMRTEKNDIIIKERSCMEKNIFIRS